MTRSLPFLRYLDLDEEADERAIRRAYARRLKQIDQEADPEAFQALREAYDAALGWAHYMQQRAQAAAPEETAVTVEEAQPEPTEPAPRPPSDPALDEDAGRAPSVDSGTMARAVLDELMAYLATRPPQDMSEGGRLLDRTLDDPRLLDLDARFLFEWGMASVFAQGWKPGHESLFGAALTRFNWREDRGRLMRLGHAGRFIDVAIDELEMYDHQPDTQRTPQRDLIRQLRWADRPSDRVLLQNLPLAEKLVATWPNWLHVITDTRNIEKWRQWESEVPPEQRASHRTQDDVAVEVRSKPSGGGNAQGAIGYVFVAIMVLGWLGKMLMASDPYPNSSASFQRLTDPAYMQQHQSRLQAPLTVPTLPLPSTPANPTPAPPPAVAQIEVAKKATAALTRGKADAKKCADTAEILGYHGSAHQKGSFGPAFDRLVLDCLTQQLWRPPIPLAAVDVSLQRNQKRTQAQLDKELATLRGSAWTPPPAAPVLRPDTLSAASPPRPGPQSVLRPSGTVNDADQRLKPYSPSSASPPDPQP